VVEYESGGLSAIQDQLNALTRMAALLLVQGCDRLSDQVDLLHRAGLQPKLIADLLETTPNTVSVQISKKRALTRMNKRSARLSRKSSEPNS
jgi:hypothetical protein